MAHATAVEQALDARDLPALRRLAAGEGGFGDAALRQRVWPFLLGVDPDELAAGSKGSPLDGTPPPALAPALDLPPAYAQLDRSSSSSLPSISSTPSRTQTSSATPPSPSEASSVDAAAGVRSLESDGSPTISPVSLPSPPASTSRASSGAASTLHSSDVESQPDTGRKTLGVDWGLFADLGAAHLPPHVDEAQILLDTRRSFVVYPRVEQPQRERLQMQLHAMLLTIFRRHPTLRYFQGYHDIASVFLLTFLPLPVLLAAPARPPTPSPSPSSSSEPSTPETLRRAARSRSRSASRSCSPSARARGQQALAPETVRLRTRLVVACVERLSLYRIRDGMGVGLEPVMGLLRVMNRVLRAADPALAKLVNRATPLPFFALSWLLTLFAHDVDSEAVIQLVFDFLLSHNPVMAVYLVVAIVLEKRELISALGPALSEDPGLLHSTLSALPVFLPTSSSAAPPPPAPTPSEAEDYLPPSARHPLPVPLPALFARAEALHARYPPCGPDVRVRELMGDKSVVFTYVDPGGEGAAEALTQEEAERVVGSLEEMVVLDPPADEGWWSGSDDDGGGGGKEAEERARLPPAGKKRPSSAALLGWPTVLAVALLAGAVGVALVNTSSASATAGRGGWADGGRRLGELIGVAGVALDSFVGGGGARG